MAHEEEPLFLFRQLLGTLDQTALDEVHQQLILEINSRDQRDRHIVRLFFSDLSLEELYHSHRYLEGETVRRQSSLEVANSCTWCLLSAARGVMNRTAPLSAERTTISSMTQTTHTPETPGKTSGRKARSRTPGQESSNQSGVGEATRAKASPSQSQAKAQATRQSQAEPVKKAPKKQAAKKVAAKKVAAKKTAATKEVSSPRAGSKGAKILQRLSQGEGASTGQLLKLTQWQAHSLRSFLSTAAKKYGVTIRSTRNNQGERTYRITK